MSFFKHPQAIIESGAQIGEKTYVGAWSHILGGARIGTECNLSDHIFVENEVVIGNRVTVKCGVFICDSITMEDDVFVGPCVAFTNNSFPRNKVGSDKCTKIIIRNHAIIGANATLLPGITIGQYAMIGAGAVVTKSVPPFAIVKGNPGRIDGYVNADEIQNNPLDHEKQGAEGKTGAMIYRIPSFSDLRGALGVIEWEKLLPFSVKRIFFTYNVPGTEVRGEHAHKKCHQFLIALHGSLHVITDNGNYRDEFILNSPVLGLHIPAGVWGIQYKHSNDCVLLVLASEKYDDSDYIRNYDEYFRYIKGNKT